MREICSHQLGSLVEARLARYAQIWGQNRAERSASVLRAEEAAGQQGRVSKSGLRRSAEFVTVPA